MTREKIPYLIITGGITGSGKTGLITETMRYLGIGNETHKKILIDDIVENNAEYKKKIKSIIKNVRDTCEEKKSCIENSYTNPTDDLYKSFADAYFSIRKQKNCNEVNPNWNCDELNDQKLTCAVLQGSHIIFEFTGQYIPSWLVNTNILGNNYKVVFSYSIVSSDNLYNRNITRAIKAIHAFEKDEKNPAPRLPDVRKSTLEKIVANMRTNLEKLYKECVKTHIDKTCGDRSTDKLLIFDNNGSGLQLIFDSDKDGDKEFENIDRSFRGIAPPEKRKKKIVKKISKRDLYNFTVAELKKKIKRLGYVGYSHLNKEELVSFLYKKL